jgi:hypothetical protein
MDQIPALELLKQLVAEQEVHGTAMRSRKVVLMVLLVDPQVVTLMTPQAQKAKPVQEL